LKTTVVPTIFDTDSEIQPEGRCISERLEKIVGKRQPVVEKIRFQSLCIRYKAYLDSRFRGNDRALNPTPGLAGFTIFDCNALLF